MSWRTIFTNRFKRLVFAHRVSELRTAYEAWTAGTHRQAIYMGDNTVMTRTFLGHLIYLDTRDTSLTPEILAMGTWERHVTKTLLRLVRPGMRCLDVGANVGFHTLTMASLTGQTGRVTSFEPNPRTVDLLRRSIQANGGFVEWTSAIAKAVSSQAGEVVLHSMDRRLGSASIGELENELQTKFADVSHDVKVQTVSLDDFVGDEPVDLIKIDVEGAERLVFEGMSNLLSRRQPPILIFEFAPPWMRRFGSDPNDLLKKLTDRNYHLWRIAPNGRAQVMDVAAILQMEHADLLAMRP